MEESRPPDDDEPVGPARRRVGGPRIAGPAGQWAHVAEDPDAYQHLPPTASREVRDEVVLVHSNGGGAWSALALRIRFDATDVQSNIAAVRAWFARRPVEEFRWLIGPSATPPGITQALLDHGAERDEDEPEVTAMVLDREPPVVIGPAVRSITSLADFETMEAIREEVFGTPRTSRPAKLGARWLAFKAAGSIALLAEIDGVAASFGVLDRTSAGAMLLAGGATRPEFRGRGAYRALVHARWELAKQMGASALVTQAQSASRPILEQLGFQATGTIEVLVDHP